MIKSALVAFAMMTTAQAAAQTPAAAPFRIMVPDAGLTGCAATGAAEAYRAHLAQRLARPVRLCAADTAVAAGAALQAGEADMVVLDRAAFAAIKSSARAVLAGRVSTDTGRVLTVALVRKTSAARTLAALTGATPIVAGTAPASKDVPMQALADAGAPVKSFKPLVVETGDKAGFAALRAGRGDLLVVTAGARQRACRSFDPKVDPCADLIEIWSGRPAATRAFVAARRMTDGERHQLVGIHIALHFEAPAAMPFIARAVPPAMALDPAEASALLTGAR